MRPSLDPRKSPWKRGDLCTLGFEKNGFVLNHTPEYLEVLWMSPHEGVERIPAEDVDNLLRVAHADGPTADGKSTNLETLKDLEALQRIKDALSERMKTVKNEDEKREADALVARSFGPQCTFDRKHAGLLFALAVDPQSVSWYWKLRERWHRFVHPQQYNRRAQMRMQESVRWVQPTLRKALAALVLLALAVGVWQYIDKQRAITAFASDLDALSIQIEESGKLINAPPPKQDQTLEEWQADSQRWLHALDDFDSQVNKLQDLLERGFRENLYGSDTLRIQGRAIQQAYVLRKQWSAKLRQIVELGISFDSKSGQRQQDEANARIAVLKNEAEDFERQSLQILAKSGLQ